MESRLEVKRKKRAGRIKRTARILSIAVILLSIANVSVEAAYYPSALETSEASLGQQLGAYRLTDQDWNVFPLTSLKGKALLLNFMYIDCHGPCTVMTQALADILKEIGPELAKSVMALSVTIDSENDTPGRLKEYSQQFAADLSRWKFVSVDDATLNLMTTDLGYSYQKTGYGYEHLNRITLIDPEGKPVKHFYGLDYKIPEVVSSLEAAVAGKKQSFIAGAFGQLLLYCSVYDPVTKTYKVDYFFIIANALQYLLVLATVGWLLRARLLNIIDRILGKERKLKPSSHHQKGAVVR